MKEIILKSGTVVICLLVFGTIFAQETGMPDSSTSPIHVDSIYDFPDIDAEFRGGKGAYWKYLRENFHYPEEALENDDQGRIYVSFVVEIDGSISGVDVMRGGLTDVLNYAAMKLVGEMPNWDPAQVNGEFVRSRCRLPITYRNCF